MADEYVPEYRQPGYPEWNPARDCGPDESMQDFAERYRRLVSAWRAGKDDKR